MAKKVKSKEPAWVGTLVDALRDGLRERGVKATVKAEHASPTKMYRFIVQSDDFKTISFSERQAVVWRIAESALALEHQVLISMILVLSKSETKAA